MAGCGPQRAAKKGVNQGCPFVLSVNVSVTGRRVQNQSVGMNSHGCAIITEGSSGVEVEASPLLLEHLVLRSRDDEILEYVIFLCLLLVV